MPVPRDRKRAGMMYQTYWGLKHSPFTAETSRAALVASPVQAEALARLDFLRETGGQLGLLIGNAGSGKSAVLAEFARRAERAGSLVCLLAAAAADEKHLLPPLTLGLQIVSPGDSWQLWQAITDRCQELQFDNLTATVLLDDLDRAAPGALDLVERLLAIPGAPLTIVASARADSLSALGSRLLDRASLCIDLAAWSEGETRDYLQDSLVRAGRQKPAFDPAATRRLFELSGGAPRKLNYLAQLALIAGAGQKLNQIDADTIDAVNEELCLARS
jgi:type II secretory pathway predicted ATPase ExeA